ncbi:MAG: hypothetical protein R6X32_06160 [Chloroflexota bacterium]
MRLSLVEQQIVYLRQQLTHAPRTPLRDPMVPITKPALRRRLPEAIARHFDRSEFDNLLYQLHIQEVEGETVEERARQLVLLVDRHGRGYELIDALKYLRPNLDWSEY